MVIPFMQQMVHLVVHAIKNSPSNFLSMVIFVLQYISPGQGISLLLLYIPTTELKIQTCRLIQFLSMPCTIFSFNESSVTGDRTNYQECTESNHFLCFLSRSKLN